MILISRLLVLKNKNMMLQTSHKPDFIFFLSIFVFWQKIDFSQICRQKSRKRTVRTDDFKYFTLNCPDNCPNVIFQEIVDNVKCGRDAPCRPQVSIPAIWNVIWGQTNLFPIRNRPPNSLSPKYQASKNGIQASKYLMQVQMV